MEKAISKEKNTFLKLSIQVRLNGLSFCLINYHSNELIWYRKIDFGKESNPVKILEEIDLVYQNEEILSQQVDEVILLFSNDLYSLVPQAFFIEEEASHYLKYNTKILKTDVVAHDTVVQDEMLNVYIPYTNITNYLFDKYGEFEYKHSVTVLVQELLKDPVDEIRAFLFNSKGYYDLVVLKGNKLLLCNTFNYETKEDFIYYLLFVAEQLKFDPVEFKLYLLGDITRSSPLFEITYTYIKNVNFLNPEFSLISKDEDIEGFQREAFLLLKSLKCE